MKAHKYWGIGAMACMFMAMISGYNRKLKGSHHFWALGSFGCMIMAVYSGYKMVHKPKKQVSQKVSGEETDQEIDTL